MLPLYSVMLGMLTLLGFFVIAAGIDKLPEFAAGLARVMTSFAAPAVLLIGWVVGTVAGTWMSVAVNDRAVYPIAIGGWTVPGYTGLWTVVLNVAVAIVLTPLFNALTSAPPAEETAAADDLG